MSPKSNACAPIAILIPSHNRPESLERCLRSIDAQTESDLTILVGDDASHPALAQPDLQRLCRFSVRLVRSDRRLDLIGMRMRLAAEATAEILVFLDDDVTLPEPDTVSRLRSVLTAHRLAAIAAPLVVDRRGDRRKWLAPPGMSTGTPKEPALVGGFVGATFAVRRNLAAVAGPVMVSKGYGHEEIELSFLAANEGHTIVCDPTIVVEHHRSPAPPGRNLRQERFFFAVRNRLLIARRYLPRPYRSTHVGLWLLRYLIRGLRLGLLSAYARGVKSGLTEPIPDRHPISPAAIAYLSKHGGRLWY